MSPFRGARPTCRRTGACRHSRRLGDAGIARLSRRWERLGRSASIAALGSGPSKSAVDGDEIRTLPGNSWHILRSIGPPKATLGNRHQCRPPGDQVQVGAPVGKRSDGDEIGAGFGPEHCQVAAGSGRGTDNLACRPGVDRADAAGSSSTQRTPSAPAGITASTASRIRKAMSCSWAVCRINRKRIIRQRR